MQTKKPLIRSGWLQRTLAAVVLCLLILCSAAGPVFAQNTSTDKKAETTKKEEEKAKATAQAVGSAIQSYPTDTDLQRGLLVMLDSKDTKKVKLVTEKDMQSTFGIVVSPKDAPISVGVSQAAKIAYVATSGSFTVVVSDQGGQIKKNDLLTVSTLDGVAMKASEKESTVVGKALTNFDGKTNTIGQVTLKDSHGEKVKTVNLGSIPVAFEVGSNPLQKSTRANLPEMLVRTGLVPKDVQPIRIYLSIGILAIAIVVAITVLYAGIRHSVISIGRNPLSRGSIARGLLSIFLSAFIILIIGCFTVYLILKL